jgi:hypothetical protein
VTAPARPDVRRYRLLALVVLVVLAASACRVRTEVGVDVNEDGSGTVTIRVGLDDDAIATNPGYEQALRIDDLRATGWTVTGPTKEADGFTYVQVTKPFANPDEANQIFAEVSGPNGPFRDFRLSRSRSFARTSTHFDGTVDFTGGGLEKFADSDLAAQLDGKPLGDDVAAIEARLGEKLDKVFQFKVAVRLPGDVTSNAPARALNGAVWEPKLSDAAPTVLTASGRSWRTGTLIGTGVAALAAFVLLLVLLIRLAIFLKDRRSTT